MLSCMLAEAPTGLSGSLSSVTGMDVFDVKPTQSGQNGSHNDMASPLSTTPLIKHAPHTGLCI